MIINAAHDFGFVHIPKCAGSTIRQQLREQDDLGGKFYHTMTLPEIGRINGNHVPLYLLDSHFPDDMARLRAVTSYAIVREPLDRFVSAVAQYMRSHISEPAELTTDQILAETDRIISSVQADSEQREIRNTIFFRQVDYVYLGDEKIIDHVYAMEHLKALIARIAERHGLELRGDSTWNPTVTYRVSGLSQTLKRLNSMSRQVLPQTAYVALRDLGIRTLTKKGVPALETALRQSREVRAFVAEHYAADYELHRKAAATQVPA
ncbi:sulfotransferase family 2 domain-containing protein [Seohaeicola zhoushanensis]|uniref:Sulfotransferase family protein n=1 Tax=Seohaeicola zhoushanensis TaxID=1569283 RepID=A0A8J3MAQ1_9RHOB|nr:sulfotransferase family 2 domain-containing protein [Seohaeicola zhoushanensis]GHF71700.1 hypothetical protein GCM10017056_48210 [Seohaeicola zhoushanensis]